jgi:hypothetical protein
MALTLKAEQRLQKVGLVAWYLDNPAPWRASAQHAYQYLQTNFPLNSAIRRDDLALALVPIVEVNEDLKNFLAARKLTQKYWITDFCHLIIDREWETIT